MRRVASETKKAYPGATPSELRGNSWSQETLRLLASEYTSTPWNDKFHTGWGDYAIDVLQRLSNVQSDLTSSSIQCQRTDGDNGLDTQLGVEVSQ